MATQRLTERVNFAAMNGVGASDIDEAAGTVSNVGLCGLVSENGRDYPLDVQQRDHVKYEGAKVFFDHTDAKTGRQFRDWVGVVRRPGCVASGSRGAIELFKSDPNVPKLLEALRKCPEKFGMSHVANCRTRRDKGREIVESIESVESVDIVLNPATNPKGFFRHESRGSAVATFSLKKFVERFGPKWGPKKWAAATKLVEDMGDLADAPVMDEPPADMADADPGDLKTALMAALAPLLDEAFDSGNADKAVSALKDFIKLHAKHTGKAADDSPAPPPDDAAAEEQARRPKGLAGFIAEGKTFGLKDPTTSQLAVLEAIPTAAGRRAYCDEVAARVSEAETPRSAGKGHGAGPVPKKPDDKSTTRTTEAVPADDKAFKEYVMRG